MRPVHWQVNTTEIHCCVMSDFGRKSSSTRMRWGDNILIGMKSFVIRTNLFSVTEPNGPTYAAVQAGGITFSKEDPGKDRKAAGTKLPDT